MPQQSLQMELRRVQKSIAKIVSALDEVAEIITRKESEPPQKTAGASRSKAPASRTSQSVLKTIVASKKGISVREIKTKTRLADRQVSNALYKLTKNGFITAKSRGLYVVKNGGLRA